MSPLAPALCIKCNYSLAETAQPRCPECGQGFDPAAPGTINVSGTPIGRLERFALAAPVWPMLVVILLALAWLFWKLRNPHMAVNPPHLFEGVGCLVSTCVVICLSRLLQLVARVSFREARGGHAFLKRLRSRWPAWPLILTSLTLAWMALTKGWPLLWALYLSQPSLDALADKAMSNPGTAATLAPVDAGLLRIESVEVRGGQVFLYTKTLGPGQRWGLVRDPQLLQDSSSLTLPGERRLDMLRLKGAWYVLFPPGWS